MLHDAVENITRVDKEGARFTVAIAIPRDVVAGPSEVVQDFCRLVVPSVDM